MNKLFVQKKRKGNLSVSNYVLLENRGCHWSTFVSNRGHCEFCALKNIQSKPHPKCSTSNIFLCVNEKKNAFMIIIKCEFLPLLCIK